MYASSDIYICYDDVLQAIFTQKNFRVPTRDSKPQPSDRREINLLISPAIRRLWAQVPLGNSEIFLSKNSLKNIIIQ